jgi:hypothetical protein
MAAAGAAAAMADDQRRPSPRRGLPKALIQQIADGADVILLDRIPGKAISPDDGASNASVNDY